MRFSGALRMVRMKMLEGWRSRARSGSFIMDVMDILAVFFSSFCSGGLLLEDE